MKILFIAFGSVLGFLLFSQFLIILKAKRKKGKKVEAISGQIGSKIRQGDSVLLYFFSASCRACKAQTPIFRSVQKQFNNAFEVDVAQEGDMAKKFGVMGTPSIVWVKNGIIREFWVGLRQEDQLLALLQQG
ncbi:thioredoxin 2 [bacterium BMS3Abin05]|nr:thioredoxin 2 [bacterium BMS3Abin05]GBE26237.1 thioredoxin 2 [bacterium BMS3Bbin03]HDZ12828.1 thioredoxin [Bacteroidota bacterium]